LVFTIYFIYILLSVQYSLFVDLKTGASPCQYLFFHLIESSDPAGIADDNYSI